MISEITLDVSTPSGKRKRSESIPFFFDVNSSDIKYAYPIDKGRYMRIMIGGELLDINMSQELIDSLVSRFGSPKQRVGFQPASLNKEKHTPKRKTNKKGDTPAA